MDVDELKEKIVSKKAKDRKSAVKEIGNRNITELSYMLYEAFLKEIGSKNKNQQNTPLWLCGRYYLKGEALEVYDGRTRNGLCRNEWKS